MSIQWFPGHMTAAKKKAEEALETNDLVIEVLAVSYTHLTLPTKRIV